MRSASQRRCLLVKMLSDQPVPVNTSAAAGRCPASGSQQEKQILNQALQASDLALHRFEIRSKLGSRMHSMQLRTPDQHRFVPCATEMSADAATDCSGAKDYKPHPLLVDTAGSYQRDTAERPRSDCC